MKINFKKYPLPKRLRHHTAPNSYFAAEELKVVPMYYPPLYKTIDWGEHFGDGRQPDMLDIGCGKGGFLLSMAELNPEMNLLGIEVREPVVEWICNFVKCEKVTNCSALWYSVVNGMEFIADNSIAKAFYLFPDPWPKTKHLKRRAFSSEFLVEIERVLKPGGELYLATDMPVVHDYHKDLLIKFGKLEFREVVDDADWALPVTNKESFCRKMKIPFDRIICRKI